MASRKYTDVHDLKIQLEMRLAIRCHHREHYSTEMVCTCPDPFNMNNDELIIEWLKYLGDKYESTNTPRE